MSYWLDINTIYRSISFLFNQKKKVDYRASKKTQRYEELCSAPNTYIIANVRVRDLTYRSEEINRVYIYILTTGHTTIYSLYTM